MDLRVDHARIVQVVSNLIDNASKCTRRSEADIRITLVDGSDVTIDVTDNGPGSMNRYCHTCSTCSIREVHPRQAAWAWGSASASESSRCTAARFRPARTRAARERAS